MFFFSGAFKFVKGFEIVRYDITNKPSCYILDLSNVTWDENSLEQMNVSVVKMIEKYRNIYTIDENIFENEGKTKILCYHFKVNQPKNTFSFVIHCF